MDVAGFLLNCTSTLPNAEEISAKLLGGGEEDESDEEVDNGDNGDIGGGEKAGDAKPAAVPSIVANGASAAAVKSSKPSPGDLQSILSSQPNPTFTNSCEIEVSCINPRGKFQLSMYKQGMVLSNPKKEDERIPISPTNVKHVIWFRKPEDYKKVKQMKKNEGNGKGSGKAIPGHMVLICLDEGSDDAPSGVMFRNKPLSQVCFQLPSYPAPSNDNEEGGNKQITEEAWWNGMRSALFVSGSRDGMTRVHATMDMADYARSNFVFKSEGEAGSTTTTEGMPYVGCYQGFNDGALFPLREGLLFFKPPLFVPRSKLASISCGRGSGGSRYVDMVVQLDVPSSDLSEDQEGKKKKKQSDTLEFTNIHRDELTGLNDYIHQTLIPAMQLDADGADKKASTGSDGDSDDEDLAVAEVVDGSDGDEDDEDNTGSGDDEEHSNKRRRPSRAASRSAREINRAALKAAPADDGENDSDDSDEFQDEEAESDDSEDESVVSDGSSPDEDESDEDEQGDMDGPDGSDYEDEGDRKGKKARID